MKRFALVRVLAASCCLAAIAPATGGAQRPSGFALSTYTRSTTARTTIAGTTIEHHGRIFSTDGRIGWNRLGLLVSYAQGSLDPGNNAVPGLFEPAVAPVDYVEGSLGLAVPVLPGLEISAGVLARAFVSDTAQERWLYWPVRARYDAPVMGPLVGAYVELWRAIAGAAPGTLEFERGTGGSVGLIARPMDGRLIVRVSYDVDAARLQSGSRRETVQGVTMGLGVATGALRTPRP